MDNIKIGIIGLGLIGGSLAKSFKRVFPRLNIIAYNRNTDNLFQAKSDGTIDVSSSEIDDGFSQCDYIFLCTPVEINEDILKKLKTIIKPSCIITDVGSVKNSIHSLVVQENLEKNFIGGHPMCGSEKSGYDSSTDHLFENSYYVLTPTKFTSEKSIEALKSLVTKIGSLAIVLEYHEHDYVVAAISHLPHLIAASLVNLIKSEDSNDHIMKTIAAGGFKDITRIASSSPLMWQQIFNTNSGNIVTLLDKYIRYLTDIKMSVENEEEGFIFDLFTSSRDYRNLFDDTAFGPIKKIFAVYIDIIDETGSISNVALLLAKNNISIKNIGILYNRQFGEEVLQVLFYSEDNVTKAVEVLGKAGYNVQKR